MKKRLTRLLSCLLLCAVLCGSITVPASAAGFNDVPANHWAAKEIQRCVDLGFFKGQTTTFFGLGQQMTRGAFAAVLQRFFGWETSSLGLALYEDVPADAWYAGALEAAWLHGAFTDQSDYFRPADAVTREEVAVALMRALGYGSIAGLAQTLDTPFSDITTNTGYITMAYDLGVVNGTTPETFSPQRPATREQVAVMLIRLYDKLRSPLPEVAGIVSGEPTTLCAGISPADGLPNTDAANLLVINATAAVLQADPASTATSLAEMAADYSGLFLDIPGLTSPEDAALLVELTATTRAALEDKLLYVGADALSLKEPSSQGYAYELLADLADKLVLHVAPYAESAAGLAVAPAEPPEEIYYTLRTLKRTVPAEKISLLLTTSGTVWYGSRQSGTMTGQEIDALVADGSYTAHYSERYASAYLLNAANRSNAVWYLNQDAVSARVRLARFFGVGELLLSDLSGVSGSFLSGLK